MEYKMRRRSLDDVSVGATLARDVKVPSPHSQVQSRLRMDKGTRLSRGHIKRLRKAGVTRVYIEDERTSDLEPYLHDEKLEAAEEKVLEEFQSFQDEIQSGDLDDGEMRQFESAVTELIEALKGSEAMVAFTRLKSYHNYTAEHSLDVTKIALKTAIKFQSWFEQKLLQETAGDPAYVKDYMLQDLAVGSMLHDLGKTEITRDVLDKEDELNDQEWDQVQQHPRHGVKLLEESGLNIRSRVKVPIRQHHEQYAGEGYPNGLSEQSIHLHGRISACADVYSALTSRRPYRQRYSCTRALEIMDSMQEGKYHFDPEVFERFKKVVLPYPIGQEVTLDKNQVGIVVDVDEDKPRQPIVRILEQDGESLEEPVETRANVDSGPSIH